MVYPNTHQTVGEGRSAGASPATSPRRWNAEGFLPFRLEVLTPILVGSGEDLSPLEYVIREESGGYALHLTDAAAWLLAERENSAVSAALNAGEMLTLRRLMTDRLDVNLYSLGRVPIQSSEVARTLQARITDPRSLSKAEVMSFVRNPVTRTAILPGSSLKGAISTPLIDHMDRLLTRTGGENLKRAMQFQGAGYQATLKKMFGDIGEHAMQALKVADIAVPPEGTSIWAAREMSLKPDKSGTPKPPCEALSPSCSGGLPLYGSLHLDCRSSQPAIQLPGGAVFEWKRIVALCNDFYKDRFLAEWDRFYRLPHFKQARDALLPVRQRIEKLHPETDLLVRVGRYSHIECVTVRENAPQIKKGYGKTRTLADGVLPFGWAILHFCPYAEYVAGIAAVEEAIAEARRQRKHARAEHEAHHARLLEQQRQKAAAIAAMRERADAEKRKHEEEAARLEAELAALSPQERAIVALARSGATEKESMDLFMQLDILDPGLQQKAAAALKAYWGSIGKWAGKQSDKQKKKIARVKEILAE